MSLDKIYLMRPSVGEEELTLIKEVIESKYLVEGPMTRQFEDEAKDYIGVTHAIACTSATTGLELALRAMGVGPGDEVIVPDFTHPATALTVMTVGAKPVLVDVELETRNTNAEIIREAINKRTKAVIPVSIFGHPLDMDEINHLKEKFTIGIIEDAACSLGSEYNGKKVGSLTDISVFSYHPRKVFTTGDGGLITTDNDGWRDLIVSMKTFGSGKTQDGEAGFVRWGTNYRMSNIHGAIALAQLRKADDIVTSRIEKARIYDELLSDCERVQTPEIKTYAKSNYQSYTVYLKHEGHRDNVKSEMRTKNIEVQIGTYALHTQPVFKDLKRVGSLNNSLKLFWNLLTLPLHHELRQEDQERVVSELNNSLDACHR
jgi:dTDP-4-amino-4,6-dideoxygalactose transaminase